MSEKFIENLIEDFFETGMLKCSIFQINSVYEYAKNKVSTLMGTDGKSIECDKWLNFYRILLIYLTETEVAVNGVNENFKVNFNEYLLKVYGISIGELSEDEHEILYTKYTDFVRSNCCDRCLEYGISSSCKNCPCGDMWLAEANN